MKKILVAVFLSLIPFIAKAEIAANLAATNDYVFRGVSNSQHRPALQGGMDYSNDTGLYAGTRASTVDFNDGNQARYELDIYTGYLGSKDALSWNAGVLSFSYPGAAKSLQYDGYKYLAEMRHAFSFATLGAYYEVVPNYLGSGAVYYLEGLAIIPLPDEFNLDFRLGRQRFSNSAMLGVADFTFRSLALQKRSGDWDMRLTWQSNGLAPAECFAGQDWCSESINVLVTRSFSY